ncbi:3-ketoacyl-ACP reductase [Achromobacter marplatensis]|uniref:3-oxoacyl-[acyl-carrier protein] reductase n=1 Tax=Achromobacter marplatensis TaxID=470868 RepID=A0ABX9G1A9_9BURK|nr:SDR family oxidoreductase [Achromobacter marplatensis]OWT69813.1 3-ketoacyl-ACP reductase [Achromobacter marplatensis]RBP13915.1 3-oxoacyl-[acyl-carrier protein] reductase [Achromobacter marplatensis]CAB3631325.1 3-oxoacyl-[acyl-carrier-protein] reductase FabG [Achromobacter marplatensis]
MNTQASQSTATAQRVALVTGGSRGIGAAIVRRLARDGFAVGINYASNSAQADVLAKEIQQAGGRAVAVQADVSRAADVRALFDKVESELGRISALVNSAGVLKVQPLADTSDEDYAQTFDINTRGTFNTLREAATRLADGGSIVNVSSTTIALNLPGYAVYIASKAAIESFTHVFSKELRGRRITVNAVAPGPVATELFLKGKSPELIEHFAKMPPLERLGQPDDIAGVVSFLTGPDSGWVNGQILRANGGVA